EMVANYSVHTQGRACIVRIPPVWDPALTDDRLANISRILRLNKPLSNLEEGTFCLQWVQLKDLASTIITLLESHWSGTEIMHCYSYSGSLVDSLLEIAEIMGSGSGTKDLKAIPQFLRKTVAQSPTLKEKIESFMGWESLDFLRAAPLGMKQTLRLFPEPSLKISTFLNQFPRTKKRR
ncbi:hypothetical protein HOF92_10315, partial [bacterium]|nr:hypothetical protein [bacterium]